MFSIFDVLPHQWGVSKVDYLIQYDCLPRATQNDSCGTGVKLGNSHLHLAPQSPDCPFLEGMGCTNISILSENSSMVFSELIPVSSATLAIGSDVE